MLSSICRVSDDSKTSTPNLVTLDQRFGGSGGMINEMAIQCVADLLGMAQRNHSFYFTFAQKSGPGQTVIVEASSQAAIWVEKKSK